MKMDCYPRFKKSPLVKDCLLAEMEGKDLPIGLPQEKQSNNQHQSSQFTGIWRRHRVRLRQDQNYCCPVTMATNSDPL